MFIQHGADVHAEDDEALRWAAEGYNADIVRLLIQHGANVRSRHYKWAAWLLR